jgi:hypothetical protein
VSRCLRLFKGSASSIMRLPSHGCTESSRRLPPSPNNLGQHADYRAANIPRVAHAIVGLSAVQSTIASCVGQFKGNERSSLQAVTAPPAKAGGLWPPALTVGSDRLISWPCRHTKTRACLSISASVGALRKRGIVTSWHEAAERMFGYSADEMRSGVYNSSRSAAREGHDARPTRSERLHRAL